MGAWTGSRSAPRVNGTEVNGVWKPPETLRIVEYTVTRIGIPAACTLLLLGIIIGKIESPLLRIPAIEADVSDHAAASNRFQEEYRTSSRNARCMQAMAATAASELSILTAAVAAEPCTLVEAKLLELRLRNNRR